MRAKVCFPHQLNSNEVAEDGSYIFATHTLCPGWYWEESGYAKFVCTLPPETLGVLTLDDPPFHTIMEIPSKVYAAYVLKVICGEIDAETLRSEDE